MGQVSIRPAARPIGWSAGRRRLSFSRRSWSFPFSVGDCPRTPERRHDARGGAIAALVGIVLLVADVLLPIPSSFVLTALGTTLGGIGGHPRRDARHEHGMRVGRYGLGHALGPARANDCSRETSRARPRRPSPGHGMLALAACRAVPVLAEASVPAAGILRLPVRRVLPATALANLGNARKRYAALGATVTKATSRPLSWRRWRRLRFVAGNAGRPSRRGRLGVGAWVRRPPEGAGAKGKEDIHAVRRMQRRPQGACDGAGRDRRPPSRRHARFIGSAPMVSASDRRHARPARPRLGNDLDHPGREGKWPGWRWSAWSR